MRHMLKCNVFITENFSMDSKLLNVDMCHILMTTEAILKGNTGSVEENKVRI